MSDTRKKRLSMLDNLAAAKAPAPAPPPTTANRALRSARDVVDGHHVWDLDPAQIEDGRISDRLDPGDVADLQDAIEANGQTVPILVRRHPTDDDRYLLVYGRRRLEAIRQSDKVTKVRALVTKLDDDQAVRAQISENMARRDLSFIEKALFARELVDSGFGSQSQVAEVLTVTKSSVSMALSIVDMIGADLARAIGPAHGIGRPRWETLARAIEDTGADTETLIAIAHAEHDKAVIGTLTEETSASAPDPSVNAFDAVALAISSKPAKPPKPVARSSARPVLLEGTSFGRLRRTDAGLRIDISDSGFADWLDQRADTVLQELLARYKSGAED